MTFRNQLLLFTLLWCWVRGQICTVGPADIDFSMQTMKLPYDQHDNGQAEGFVFDLQNPDHAESVVNKTYVITGTSSGIGYATANLLVSMGATVYGLSLDDNLPITGFTEIKCDIRNNGQIEAAITRLMFQYGVTSIDGLILNAGVALTGDLIEIPAEAALDSYNNNVAGNKAVYAALSRAGMFRNTPGQKRVLWQSSVFSRLQFVGATDYSVTKKDMREWAMEMVVTAPVEDHTEHIYTMPDITLTKFAVNVICIDPCEARCAFLTLLQNILLMAGQTAENAALGMVQALTQKLHPYVIGHYVGDPARSMLPAGTTWDFFEAQQKQLTPQAWLYGLGCAALNTPLPGGIPNVVNPNMPCSEVEYYYDLWLQMMGGKRAAVDESQLDALIAALEAAGANPVEYARKALTGL